VSVHGEKASRLIARGHSAAAVRAFHSLPGDTAFLIALVRMLASRRK
jgi:hypothetical protein